MPEENMKKEIEKHNQNVVLMDPYQRDQEVQGRDQSHIDLPNRYVIISLGSGVSK